MKKYIIERDLPGAGNLTDEELRAIAKTSCSTAQGLNVPYQWHETFVTQDKLFCVHMAESEEIIQDHSARAGFPVRIIREVKTIIDPTTSAD